jgi:hypothetical protein
MSTVNPKDIAKALAKQQALQGAGMIAEVFSLRLSGIKREHQPNQTGR